MFVGKGAAVSAIPMISFWALGRAWHLEGLGVGASGIRVMA